MVKIFRWRSTARMLSGIAIISFLGMATACKSSLGRPGSEKNPFGMKSVEDAREHCGTFKAMNFDSYQAYLTFNAGTNESLLGSNTFSKVMQDTWNDPHVNTRSELLAVRNADGSEDANFLQCSIQVSATNYDGDLIPIAVFANFFYRINSQ